MRNPPWSRDELIIALDFYLCHAPSIPDKKSKPISELSNFLNQLKRKLGGEASATYRNPNGVYMKLMNFRRFDPNYKGKGLQRGNKDEEAVWNLFFSNRSELQNVTRNIRSLIESDDTIFSKEKIADEEEEGEEGKVLTRVHRYRERDTKLVKRKKDSIFQDAGELRCEVCDFDFFSFYGDHGDGFIECHHTKPLSELRSGQITRLSELCLVSPSWVKPLAFKAFSPKGPNPKDRRRKAAVGGCESRLQPTERVCVARTPQAMDLQVFDPPNDASKTSLVIGRTTPTDRCFTEALANTPGRLRIIIVETK